MEVHVANQALLLIVLLGQLETIIATTTGRDDSAAPSILGNPLSNSSYKVALVANTGNNSSEGNGKETSTEEEREPDKGERENGATQRGFSHTCT